MLILLSSELGLLISSQSTCSQSTWSGKMIREPSWWTFKGQQRTNLSMYCTRSKRNTTRPIHNKIIREVMRARYLLITEERDCPWILAIVFLASKFQNHWKYRASLHDWLVADAKAISMNCPPYAPVRGANFLNKWLLFIRENSGSTAHIDIGVTIWISCPVGKESVGFEIRLLTINLFTYPYISTLTTTIACWWSLGQGSTFILGLFCK